ncbi:MAG: hypothetical protein HOP29_10750 [Phycisphaerales bacterium]|nr:hypothetical protein [Phycisphaerales bacterium]
MRRADSELTVSDRRDTPQVPAAAAWGVAAGAVLLATIGTLGVGRRRARMA